MDARALSKATVTALVLAAALAGCTADPDPANGAAGPIALSAPASPPATLTASPPTASPPPASPPVTPPPSAVPEPATSLAVTVADVSRPAPDLAAGEAGLDPAGAVAALSWSDNAGSNTVVLRELQPEVRGDKQLFADHIVVSTSGTRTVLREVRDAERDCEFDLTAEFVPEALQVRDDDADGFGEVLFAYRLACRSDPSPSDLKLLSLENGDKYILRGSSTNQLAPEPSEPEAEPAAESWPAGAYAEASALFDSVQQEF